MEVLRNLNVIVGGQWLWENRKFNLNNETYLIAFHGRSWVLNVQATDAMQLGGKSKKANIYQMGRDKCDN